MNAALKDGELIDEGRVAEWLHISTKTVQGWRYRGVGPRFVQVGRCVRYRPADIRDYIESGLRKSTSDPGEGRP